MEWIVELVIGIVGGVASGLLGIGGGAIFVPAMVLLLDTSQHVAQGVSLAVIVVTAASGTLVNHRLGNIDTRAVLWVTPGAMMFGFIGGAIATQTSEVILQRIFAVVLMSLSIRLLVGTMRRRPVSSATPEGSA